MNYRDIYSVYPELATRLTRTSRQLNEITSEGNCNLDLSIKEMKTMIEGTSKKCLFNLYNPGEGEGPGPYMDAIVYMHMPVYDRLTDYVIYTWHYDAGASPRDEGDYHMLTLGGHHINQQLIHDRDYIKILIEQTDGIDVKSFDVKTLYQLYNNRTSCRRYPNYAKIKTKQLFNKMIDKLSQYDTLIMLNLYLMINYIILDLNLSNHFMDSQKKISLHQDYDYEDYVEDTMDERNHMIKNILYTIDQFN